VEVLVGLVLIGGIVWFLFIHKSSAQKAAIAEHEHQTRPIAEDEGDKWTYKHQFRETAIALDPDERVIRVRGKFGKQIVQKEYSYADVRSWNFNISTGGQVRLIGNQGVNAAVSAAVINHMQNKQNEAGTGLFITVRDIDYPEWQILFPTSKGRELELKRWMEILRQQINLD